MINVQKRQLAESENHLRVLDIRISALESSVSRNAVQLTSLSASVEEMGRNMNQLASKEANDVETLEHRLSELERGLGERIAAAEARIEELAKAMNSSSGLDAAVKANAALIASTAAALAALGTRVAAAEGTIREQGTAVQANTSSIGVLGQRLSDTDNRVTDLDQFLNGTEARVETLGRMIDNTNGRVTDLGQRLSDTDNRVTDVDQFLNGTEARVETIARMIDNTNGRVGALEPRVSALENTTQSISGQIRVNSTSISNMSGAVDSLRSQISSINSSVGSHTTSISQLNADSQTHSRSISNLQISVNNLSPLSSKITRITQMLTTMKTIYIVRSWIPSQTTDGNGFMRLSMSSMPDDAVGKSNDFIVSVVPYDARVSTYDRIFVSWCDYNGDSEINIALRYAYDSGIGKVGAGNRVKIWYWANNPAQNMTI